jgi:hypothetical protein
MAGRRTATWAALTCALLLAAGCAQRAAGTAGSAGTAGTTGTTGTTGAPATHPPLASDGLVIQVRHTGGFLPVGVLHGTVPMVTVYADGRVIEEGPADSVRPGQALPNLQVRQISGPDVRALVDRALAAGVRDTTDLGRPRVMDAATTRITVVTPTGTYVRDVYALAEGVTGTVRTGGGHGPPATYPVQGLTPQQQAARGHLLDLVRALTDLESTLPAGTVGPATAYQPHAVAAVVTPAKPGPQDPPQQARPWPGPALPGQPLGQAGVSCVTATGRTADAVLAAARSARQLTPWTTADGRQWWVTFRPLLPGETGCADLAG